VSFVLEQSLLVRLSHTGRFPRILVSKVLCVQPAKGGKLLEENENFSPRATGKPYVVEVKVFQRVLKVTQF
jgi:hypothetical protein